MIISYKSSLADFVSFLESFNLSNDFLRFESISGKYTHEAKTPPAAGPRPASSVPMIVPNFLSNENKLFNILFSNK